MNYTPQPRLPGPWKELQGRLAGSFTARSRGFLGDEFIFSNTDGEELGRLIMWGLRGAKLTAGALEAVVERAAGSRYAMLTGGEEVLRAHPFGASANGLEIECGDRAYTATVGLLRNVAAARNRAGDETVRLAGNITGRGYRADIDVEDGCALPVAVLLLYHTASLRRRAYRAAVGRR
ncbi:MAG: hypothetical protein M3157_06350 [Actinomycetota bacterium]|nr:hypothetical protein [Actinomycetota bacterium]